MKHEHTAECYASNASGPLAYTPCREDGLDRNLHNMRPMDLTAAQLRNDGVARGLTLICDRKAG